MSRVAAVDLGATSVRVATIRLDAERPEVEVVHRWPHGPVIHHDGTLRWDWDGIVSAAEEGLERALANGPLASIGVDGWAVDHALLNKDSGLLGPPFCHRDPRTAGWHQVAEAFGTRRMYERTGIQLMPINTVFQLAAHDPTERARASSIVLLPDLLMSHLTGFLGTERTNATTTGMVGAATGTWDDDLLALAGVRTEQLPPVVEAGHRAGTWRDVPVHVVGSHDTSSAFLGAPGVPRDDTAIVSSGTWVLVGAERPRPDTSPAAQDANFSNEGGALGGVRFLTNVVGFWLLERCRAQWGSPPISEISEAAAQEPADVPTVDLATDRFLAPDDAEAEVRAAAGLAPDASRATVARTIIESIAAGVATAVDDLGRLTGTPRREILHVGGGSRLGLYNQRLAARTGLPVTVGSPEATALGNAVVQGLAIGAFSDADQARRWAASATDGEVVTPPPRTSVGP